MALHELLRRSSHEDLSSNSEASGADDGSGDAYSAGGRHRRYVAVEDSLFATPPPARETARGDVEGSAGFRSMFGRAIVPRSGLGCFLLWNARPFAHAR